MRRHPVRRLFLATFRCRYPLREWRPGPCQAPTGCHFGPIVGQPRVAIWTSTSIFPGARGGPPYPDGKFILLPEW